jgi:hypothetical protein
MNKIRLLIFVLCIVSIVNAQSIPNQSINVSFVDVFPLAVGNQWTYNYSYHSYDEIAWSRTVSGTVIMQIIGKSVMTDSTIWNVQRTNDLNINQNGNLYHDTSVSTLDVIEKHIGHHRLLGSEFPFHTVLPDTAMIYRYAIVDTAGSWKLQFTQGVEMYNYIFKQGTGETSYSASDLCTCLNYWNESYTLSSSTITDVEVHPEVGVSKEFILSQNYPNPFNPTTTLSFHLPSNSFVSLKIFDALGREVTTLVSEQLSAGNHTKQWNANGMPSGIYFYRLQAGSFVETKKLILLK